MLSHTKFWINLGNSFNIKCLKQSRESFQIKYLSQSANYIKLKLILANPFQTFIYQNNRSTSSGLSNSRTHSECFFFLGIRNIFGIYCGFKKFGKNKTFNYGSNKKDIFPWRYLKMCSPIAESMFLKHGWNHATFPNKRQFKITSFVKHFKLCCFYWEKRGRYKKHMILSSDPVDNL